MPLPTQTVSDSEDHPDLEVSTEPPPAPREKPMGFWGHLEELRWTLVKCAIVFTIFAVLVGCYLNEFNDVLLWPMATAQAKYPEVVMQLGTISIMEGFNVIIQMCVLGALVMSAPFMLFFIGQFVAPALTEKELKAVLPLCGSALVLFLAGAAFSFCLLVPNTIGVSVQINEMLHYKLNWTPASYYSLLMWLVLGVGASFEFPLVIVLLVWLGLVTVAFLRKYRRHAFVLCFIIAAIVTPTPDPLTQTIFAVPLYVLYEIAILASTRVERRKRSERT